MMSIRYDISLFCILLFGGCGTVASARYKGKDNLVLTALKQDRYISPSPAADMLLNDGKNEKTMALTYSKQLVDSYWAMVFAAQCDTKRKKVPVVITALCRQYWPYISSFIPELASIITSYTVPSLEACIPEFTYNVFKFEKYQFGLLHKALLCGNDKQLQLPEQYHPSLGAAALAGGSIVCLNELIKKYGGEALDEQDRFGRNLFSLACEWGKSDFVEVLLTTSCDPEIPSYDGLTGEQKALVNGHKAVVLAIKKGKRECCLKDS